MLERYTVWVIEDDALQRDGLARMLEATSMADKLDVTALSDVAELGAYVEDGSIPDIVISDIDLGEGAPSGVELAARHFASKRTQIVYTTAYLNLVTSAYATNHVYLLAKPFGVPQLEAALEKAAQAIRAAQRDYLSFSFGTGVKRVACSEIAWLESAGHRVEIHLLDGVRSTYESLRSLSSRLSKSFVRSHKSYVVNLEHVRELTDHELVMSEGSRIPVSRKYRGALKSALVEHLSIGE